MFRKTIALATIAAAALATPAGATNFVAQSGAPEECSEYAANDASGIDALRSCSDALDANLNQHDRAGTLVNRGVIYLQRGDVDHAMSDFEEANRLDSSIAEIHVNRGAAQLRQGQYEAAVASITQGLSINPNLGARAYYARAIAYEQLGLARQAYADYQRATNLAPEWQTPRAELARFAVR